MFQPAASPLDPALGWIEADPYAVRFAATGARNDPDETLRLAIRLPAGGRTAFADTFLLTLMAASSRRTLWTLRHAPTYWRIAPLDIPLFRLCQDAMALLRPAQHRTEWLLAPASRGVALYFQSTPDAPFVLLSSDAARLKQETLLSCAD